MTKTKGRGRKSWPPIKAKFLEAYRDQWEDARRVKKMPTFYDRLTAAFIARFGYDLGHYVDPKEETEEDLFSLVEGEKIPGLVGVEEEESKKRAAHFDSLRTKLTVWCNHHYRKINDNTFRDETASLFRQIARTECDNLRRKPAYQVYQTLYYKERVLSTFNDRWAAAVAEAQADDSPVPSMLAIRQKAVQECWENETSEIKDEVHRAIQADLERRTEEMKNDLSPPETPEDYQDRLECCAPFIKAIAEGLRERTGLAVSILLAGPVPKNDGEIGLRSYHAGTTNDVSPRDWPKFDPAGFTKVEDSVLSFASYLYPPHERRRRSLLTSEDPSRSCSPAAASTHNADDQSRMSASRGSEQRELPASERQATPGPSTLETHSPSRVSSHSPPPRSPSPQPANASAEARDETTHPDSLPSLAVDEPSAPLKQAPVAALPLNILVDGGCPTHLIELYKRLVTAEFDITWTACMAAFARLQLKLNFQDPKGAHLPLSHRPEEYPVWFKYRRLGAGPPIESYKDFLRRLSAWWWSMQPTSRGDDGRARSSAAADWSKLLTPGQNGIYLVLCGLLWVGTAIFEGEEQALLPDWSTLVDDVAWVLQRDIDVADIAEPASAKKRSGDNASVRSRKRAKF